MRRREPSNRQLDLNIEIKRLIHIPRRVGIHPDNRALLRRDCTADISKPRQRLKLCQGPTREMHYSSVSLHALPLGISIGKGRLWLKMP
jgi:hypothetical protein